MTNTTLQSWMVLNMQNLVGLLCQVENYLLSFYDSSKSQIGHSNLCFWLTSLSLCCDTGCMVEHNNYLQHSWKGSLIKNWTYLQHSCFKLWWVAVWFTLFYFDVWWFKTWDWDFFCVHRTIYKKVWIGSTFSFNIGIWYTPSHTYYLLSKLQMISIFWYF